MKVKLRILEWVTWTLRAFCPDPVGPLNMVEMAMIRLDQSYVITQSLYPLNISDVILVWTEPLKGPLLVVGRQDLIVELSTALSGNICLQVLR